MEYLDALEAAHPGETRETVAELRALLRDKLWFQLSAALLRLASDQASFFAQAPRLGELYAGLVASVEKRLKPLHLAQIVTAAARQLPTPAEGLAFLEPFAAEGGVLEGEMEAAVAVRLAAAEFRLAAGDADACGDALEEAEREMREHPGVVDNLVQSAFHHTALLYYKERGPATRFFDSAIMYLAHTPVEQIPAAEQLQLASAVGLAAIVGQRVYNFGELLQHPVVDVLGGTEHEWIRDLLHAFNEGNIARYEAIAAARGASDQVLAANAAYLNQKIRIMALMELVFRRASDDRVISFADVAAACSLALPEVELLLIKAFSIGVVRGTIDEVDASVAVTWVQPRVLSSSQVASMRDRLGDWSAKVNQTATLLEDSAGEILQHYN